MLSKFRNKSPRNLLVPPKRKNPQNELSRLTRKNSSNINPGNARSARQTIGTTISPMKTCPSTKCWRLTKDGCKLKNRKKCDLKLKCSSKHLQATFPEGLFDLAKVDQAQGSPKECSPKLIGGIWQWKVQLGKCDMQIEKINYLNKE